MAASRTIRRRRASSATRRAARPAPAPPPGAPRECRPRRRPGGSAPAAPQSRHRRASTASPPIVVETDVFRGDQPDRRRPAPARAEAAPRHGRQKQELRPVRAARRPRLCRAIRADRRRSAESHHARIQVDCRGNYELPTVRVNCCRGDAGGRCTARREGDQGLSLPPRTATSSTCRSRSLTVARRRFSPWLFPVAARRQPPAGDSAMVPTFTGVAVSTQKVEVPEGGVRRHREEQGRLSEEQRTTAGSRCCSTISCCVAAEERNAARVLHAQARKPSMRPA